MPPITHYQSLQRSLAAGWNTWSTRSVLTHVLLPEGIALSLGVKEYRDGFCLREALIGRFGDDVETVIPGLHTMDGSYTELLLKWRGLELSVRTTATPEDDFILLATPLVSPKHPATLVASTGLLWNRPGSLARINDHLRFTTPTRTLEIFPTGSDAHDLQVDASTPFLTLKLDRPVVLATHHPRSVEEATALLDAARSRLRQSTPSLQNSHSEALEAMSNCLAWDTIYEPSHDRVISTVSRIWNISHGGYALFCWDTYFAAAMAAAAGSRSIAYANAVEITHERLAEGFVPNYAYGRGCSSRDRSQPPVGSAVVLNLFQRYGESWLPELLFDDLLGWNTWFYEHRRNPDGTFSWGSDPVTIRDTDYPWAPGGAGERLGAALESGLDNSPMYDDIPYDPATHCLTLADVGLTGLVLLDTDSLLTLAELLGRTEAAALLRTRLAQTDAALETLWNEDLGLYCNRRTDTGAFSPRLSPTNFYALFSRSIPSERITRMLREHLLNPAEFGGEWMLPSIARNDPAYPDQTYWRGRIWAPLNYLVGLALQRHPEATEALATLADSSERLLLREWRSHGHVHENYSGDTGDGCGVPDSDRFYHWGGLLALLHGLLPA